MTAGRSTTHDIEIRDDIVIKRYRSWERGEHRREWAALNVLAEHAPGLAPAPVRADLDGSPPTVVMSRLPGTPLRGLPTGPEQVRALATALTHLHHAISGADPLDSTSRHSPDPSPGHPLELATGHVLKPAAWHPAAAVAHVRALAAAHPDLGDSPGARRAFTLGTAWLSDPSLDRLPVNPFPPVLGMADGNLANYLWDSDTARVHIIDWEDSGLADRAFELAEVAEHISHVDGDLDRDLLLAHLGLAPAEAARVHEFRRLLALGWLLMLGPDGPATRRNPPGTLDRQAERVLALLDS
ncbi:aminoglycoside phosphotransferase family protein [Nonomuraea sp. NPDC049625]|uniref:phosphotransferase family protein n=1 Tax=Nonomuraea sp. NPDC049625 TaxID=3155775 RepID=UPI00341FBAC6